MSLLTGKPHLQYCPKCGWKNPFIANSDALMMPDCPECQTHLHLKPLSDLSFIEQMQVKLAQLKLKHGTKF